MKYMLGWPLFVIFTEAGALSNDRAEFSGSNP
jgi:hypothetical protein